MQKLTHYEDLSLQHVNLCCGYIVDFLRVFPINFAVDYLRIHNAYKTHLLYIFLLWVSTSKLAAENLLQICTNLP